MRILLFFLITAGTDAATTVTGSRGGSVQIKCPYRSGSENNNKYLCRGRCPAWPGAKDIPVKSGSPPKDGRFSLIDDKPAKVFTVTITDLRAEDANTYWCVIQKTWTNDYSKILLRVDADYPAISTVSPFTHNTSVLASGPSMSAETPSTTEFPTTTLIITVSVLLALLLVALSFAVAVQRKNKRATSPSKTQKSSSNNCVAPPSVDGCSVKESRCLSNPLYATAQLPTSPCTFSKAIYSNTGLPTVPSDEPQTVYSAVKHPLDSPAQDLYSTAQLPTIPSDPSVSAVPKSAEIPTYAEVMFKARSNRAVQEAIHRNENTSCDYATIVITKC